MSDIKKLKGKDRLLKEYDELTNDPDINNCFGIDYWDPDAPILIFFIGKLHLFLQ